MEATKAILGPFSDGVISDTVFKPKQRTPVKEEKIFKPPPLINIDVKLDTIEPENVIEPSPVRSVRMPVVSQVVSHQKVLTREINPRTPILSTEEQLAERVSALVSNPSDYNYDDETSVVKEACKEMFVQKFHSLARNYPNRGIKIPETDDLNKIHNKYHSHLKDIFVESNLANVQCVYIICMLVLEIVMIKYFKIPMSGFTKSEIKRFYKYQTMFIELGHSILPYGQSNQPVEIKMLTTFVINVIIFAAIKILAGKIASSDEIVEMIRNVVDKFIEPQVSMKEVEQGPETVNMAKEKSKQEAENIASSGGFRDIDFLDTLTELGTNFGLSEEKKNAGTKKSKFRFTD